MLDHEGYLALFERKREGGEMVLQPGRRIFVGEDGPLRLNAGRAGKSGRRKFCFADWNRDGATDLLVNSASVDLFQQIDENHFRAVGPVITATALAGHTTSPTIVDWDRNSIPDLLIGAEDGYLYYLRNPGASK